MNSLWLLMLPVAATFGYMSAVRKRSHQVLSRTFFSRDHYFEGLNFLLNDEADKALSSFIKMLEVDGNTVETHLALGSLFRRRGEVERAIRIHQNLIAKPQLKVEYRLQALYELAKDYLSAGMLDRAERLFLELLEEGSHIEQSAKGLVYIYQREKEWQKAIHLAQKFIVQNDESRIALAQYYCEQAQIHAGHKELVKELKCLRKAIAINPYCARARLRLADLQMHRGHYRSALRSLNHIREKNPDWLLPAMPKLQDSYLALQKPDLFINYLEGVLKDFPKMPILVLLTEQMRQYHGDQAALCFVKQHVRDNPTYIGLQHLLQLQVSVHQTDRPEDWNFIHDSMKKLTKASAGYRCVSCGYGGTTLHWQCPSCRNWETIKPNYLHAAF